MMYHNEQEDVVYRIIDKETGKPCVTDDDLFVIDGTVFISRPYIAGVMDVINPVSGYEAIRMGVKHKDNG